MNVRHVKKLSEIEDFVQVMPTSAETSNLADGSLNDQSKFRDISSQDMRQY